MVSLSCDGVWRLLSEHCFDVDNQCFNQDLFCTICNKLMVDACHSVCGCRYCYKCITEYLRDGERFCPGDTDKCKEEYLVLDADVVRDRRINNRIARLKVKCPNGTCESRVELAKMEDHLRLCDRQSPQCPYVAIGCGDNIEVNDTVLVHLEEEKLNHTQLLIDWIHNLKNELDGMKVTMNEELRMKDNQIRDLAQQVEELRNGITIPLEKEVERKEAVLEGQQLGLGTEDSLKDNVDFVWKIDECSKKRGPTIFSESFYSNKYKLCLSMFLYGDSVGLNCVIMRGDNDNELQWPMTRAVTLSIVDQVTQRPHKSQTFQCSTYCNRSAFERPTSDKSNYIGANPFVLYSAISNMSSIIVNDCIVVSCTLSDPQ